MSGLGSNVVELRPDEEIRVEAYSDEGFILIRCSKKDARMLIEELQAVV